MKPGGYVTELKRLTGLEDSKFSVDEKKADEIDAHQQAQQDAEIQETQKKIAAEAAVAQAESERKAAEGAKFAAEAKAAESKAGALDAQAELHISKAELADAQAMKIDREGEVDAEAAGPGPEEIAKADRVYALTPHEIALAAQRVESERAITEANRARAEAAATPPAPPERTPEEQALAAQKVETEKGLTEINKAKAKVAAIPPPKPAPAGAMVAGSKPKPKPKPGGAK
jgi:hypothetical protein